MGMSYNGMAMLERQMKYDRLTASQTRAIRRLHYCPCYGELSLKDDGYSDDEIKFAREYSFHNTDVEDFVEGQDCLQSVENMEKKLGKILDNPSK